MKADNLPAGLVDQDIEFFMHFGELKALHDGTVKDFNDIPKAAITALINEMEANTDVMATFLTYGIDLLDDQVYTYTKCMYGGFNSVPDIVNGKVGEHDNHNCGDDCQCVLRDIVKHMMPVANGHLTKRELDITRLLTHNYLGKQIASELHISPYTVDKHKQNIFRKTGLTSNVELAVWATNNNVV